MYAIRSYYADDDHIARLHALVQDALAGFFLAFADDRRTGEFEDRVVNTGGFYHAALLGEIAEQDSKAAILREGMLSGADDSFLAVGVEFLVSARLARNNFV